MVWTQEALTKFHTLLDWTVGSLMHCSFVQCNRITRLKSTLILFHYCWTLALVDSSITKRRPNFVGNPFNGSKMKQILDSVLSHYGLQQFLEAQTSTRHLLSLNIGSRS